MHNPETILQENISIENLEIKSLENTPFSEIVACFNLAFSDYFVPIAASEAYMEKRWYGNRVDYKLSFGAFENQRLVAFIIHGIDSLNGQKTAYNSGTGVIPEFRGRRLVAALYAHALPVLKAAEVTQSTLEVITQNHKALKAYQNVGFEIVRTLHCFKGSIIPQEIPVSSSQRYQIQKQTAFDPEKLKPLQAFAFSWENQNAAINLLMQDLECWQVWAEEKLKGYIVLNPATGTLLQFGFEPAEIELVAMFLLQAIGKCIPNIRINNVDSKAEKLSNLLQQAGLENHLDQYEMILKLPT